MKTKPKTTKKAPGKSKTPGKVKKAGKAKEIRPEQKKKLTNKEQMFCIEYCSNGYNGTRAAIKAGYSEKAAKEIASRALTKANIKNEINRLRGSFEELAAEKGITKMAILLKHWELATASIAHLHNTWIKRIDFELLTEEQKNCISEISTQIRTINIDGQDTPIQVEYVKIKLYDKQKALDSIGKIMGYDAPVKTDLGLKIEAKDVHLTIDGKDIDLKNEPV